MVLVFYRVKLATASCQVKLYKLPVCSLKLHVQPCVESRSQLDLATFRDNDHAISAIKLGMHTGELQSAIHASN